MAAKLNPSRYAHCDGHTGVCFSQDASYIVTCGGEGDIRIWTGIEDDEATDKCVGEKAFAVCQRGDKLYVATDQNNVQALTFPEPELDGVVARFTAPVVGIDASEDGSLIVSASCDMTIGITDTEKSTTEVLTGHRAPVLSVALDPKLEYIASSSCDGTVRVWRLSSKQEVVSWVCVPKANSFQHAEVIGQSAWTPRSGALLAVPHHSEVHLYSRDIWENTITFADPSPSKQMFSIVSFSSCGSMVAASSTQGHIIVWTVATQRVLACVQTDEAHHICSLAWSPQLPQIAFTDVNGQFGTVDLQVSQHQESDMKPEDVPIADPMFGDTDDEDDVNAISLDKIKNESGFGLLDDEQSSVKGGEKEDDGRLSRLSDVRPVVSMPQVELQPPFQPSSTPTSLQFRFMIWNDIGIVKQTNTEDENTIDVEFHDTSLHHAFRVNNVAGHSLAALSSEALVMACEATDDNPSKVVCVLLNAWDGSKEWTVTLQDDEEALCVAAGNGYVAVATDARLLRVFTTCGTQREVISLPGPVVCMAPHQHCLAVAYHSGTGLDGEQQLSVWQLWLGSPGATLVRRCTAVPIALTPRARLRWLGHSDRGALCALDSAGSLRLLTPSTLWTLICEVDKQCKGKSDHHFVLGVNEQFQTIRSVLCKGSYFPPTTPRPTVTEISWQIPLCEGTAEKGQLEEEFWRCQFALPTLGEEERDSADRTIKKTLIKLFALACQSGLEMRAVGLCQLMTPELVQLAIKYASKLGRPQLADRIEETISRRPPSPPPTHDSLSENADNFPVPRRELEQNTNGHSYPLSPDMFASNNEDSSGQDNPILALKQRQPNLGLSSALSNKLKRANPFVKKMDGKDENDKGLAGLVKQAAKPIPEPSVTKSVINENKTKKPNFMEWFSIQKESLQEEFPELDSSELTKVALKRFKEEQKPKTNNGPSVKDFFGRTSSNQEKNVLSEESSSTTTTNCESPDSKKRKAKESEIEKPEAKKTSASSKLKKFSFVKP